jgi:hypothetical protein
MIVGEIMVVTGIVTFIVIKIYVWCRPRPRVTGFDAETAELLSTPRHEVLAKQLAQMHGYPPLMWRKFTPLAVSYILASRH